MSNKTAKSPFRIRLGAFIFFCLLFLLLGFAVAKYRLPGYPYLSGAFGAAKSVGICLDLKWFATESSHHIKGPFDQGGLVRRNAAAMQPGMTFITYFADGEYRAGLLDEAGEWAHQWTIPYADSVALAPKIYCSLDKTNLFIHGAHLYPNGDILVSYEYQGLLKLDRESNLLWELDMVSHHSIEVADDGTIWTLGRIIDMKSERVAQFDDGFYLKDTLVKISPEGEILAEYPLIDLLFNNGFQGLLMTGHNQYRYANYDPLHTNDVKVLTGPQAATIPQAKAGDLLISMRAISTIMVVRPDENLVVWSKTGPFLRQHDPEIGPDGLLWVFDNRNATPQKNTGAEYLPEGQAFGPSQVLALPLDSQMARQRFVGTPEEPFFTSIMGRMQLLANGNLLLVEPEGGRIFEVTMPAGKVVWEYRNLITPGTVGRVSDADRYPRQSLRFLAKAKAPSS